MNIQTIMGYKQEEADHQKALELLKEKHGICIRDFVGEKQKRIQEAFCLKSARDFKNPVRIGVDKDSIKVTLIFEKNIVQPKVDGCFLEKIRMVFNARAVWVEKIEKGTYVMYYIFRVS